MHGVKSCTTPHTHGPKAKRIHLLRYGYHVFGAPSGGKDGLVRIPKGQILNLDRIGHLYLFLQQSSRQLSMFFCHNPLLLISP